MVVDYSKTAKSFVAPTPPPNTRIISAETFLQDPRNRFDVKDIDPSRNIEFDEVFTINAPNLVIRGDLDLNGKQLLATCNKLWIEGNVTNGEISVESPEVKQFRHENHEDMAGSQEAILRYADHLIASAEHLSANLDAKENSDAFHEHPDKKIASDFQAKVDEVMKKAAAKGDGLFISGNVKNVNLAAHNISIGGDVTAGNRKPIGSMAIAIEGTGGDVQIGGNFTAVAGAHFKQLIGKESSIPPQINKDLSKIEYVRNFIPSIVAIGDIVIDGDVKDVALESQTGNVTLSDAAKQDGYVIVVEKSASGAEKGAQFLSSPVKHSGAGRV